MDAHTDDETRMYLWRESHQHGGNLHDGRLSLFFLGTKC